MSPSFDGVAAFQGVWIQGRVRCCLHIFTFLEIRAELALTDAIRAKSQFGEVERDFSRKDI